MTHSDIINEWPSLSDFAEDLGVQYGTAKAMRRRNSIPPEYWMTVVNAARKRKIKAVKLESLAASVAKTMEAAE